MCSENPIDSSFYVPLNWSKGQNIEELVEYYNQIKKDQILITGFGRNSTPGVFLLRTKIVQWIFFVCQNLHFKNETAFKAVSLFDVYLAMQGKKTQIDTNSSQEIQLIAVGCLSIASKMEEVNCNYINFLNEKLLENKQGLLTFTVKNLAYKELEILKKLKFRTSFPNINHFNTIFIQIALQEIQRFYNKQIFLRLKCINYNNFRTEEDFTYSKVKLNFLAANLINLNDSIMKVFAAMSDSVFISPLAGGLTCVKAALIAVSGAFPNEMRIICSAFNKKLEIMLRDEEYLNHWEMVAYSLLNASLANFTKMRAASCGEEQECRYDKNNLTQIQSL